MYEFRCPGCGPFDLQRSMQQDTDGACCPTCARAAPRSYAVGGAVGLAGPLRGAGRADRARVDRAHSGEPRVTAGPAERRLPRSAGHGH
ncbi:FmdB family zinc ribbon protein [Geodermatophilus normandii]|uniref:FmdB family zinc ribbon protein n=1 Tax=Geodermatophilus normandii TaxID=1137989 RepID=UPI003CCC4C9B